MMNICIVLAGGLGTRLQSVIAGMPKSLAPVGGKSFLERQITSLAHRGIDKFIFSLGHGSEKIINSISQWTSLYSISIVVEQEQLGTGGAIKFVMSTLGLDETLVINGDTFLSGDLTKMMLPINSSQKEIIRCGLIVTPRRERYGGVVLSSDGTITNFFEKGTSGSGLINAGIYRINYEAFRGVNESIFSLESRIFPSLCAEGSLHGTILNGKFIDIGVPEDYKLFCDTYHEYL